MEAAFEPARSRIGQCIEQIGLDGVGTTPAPEDDGSELLVFGHVRPGMPACWVEQRRSACEEAGAVDGVDCGVEFDGAGPPLDAHVRMQIAQMHCSAEDELCRMSRDIALGVGPDPMLMDLMCGRPLRLPDSMESQIAREISAEEMGEISAACGATELGVIAQPDDGSPMEPGPSLGEVMLGSVVIPPPFRPDPDEQCLTPPESGRFYGNFWIMYDDGALCGAAASCAREIIAATDRVQARVDRRQFLNGREQEADRIAAACGETEEVAWAVEWLRTRLFIRSDFGGSAMEPEPEAPTAPEAPSFDLPDIDGIPDDLFEPLPPTSPIDSLPPTPPIPEELLSAELGAHVTFAASDGDFKAFRDAFCGLDVESGSDMPAILSGPSLSPSD